MFEVLKSKAEIGEARRQLHRGELSFTSEISRLLRPGGYFVASFDYWPEKIDTSGVTFFGKERLIFSEREVRGFIEEAKSFNPTTPLKIDLVGADRRIKCANKEYTFAWSVLQKTPASIGSVEG
jgi:hypothetical protein